MNKVVFKNRNGEKLFGSLYSCQSDTVMLILPGAGEPRQWKFYTKLATLANKYSIDGLVLDLSSEGESEGDSFYNTPRKHTQDIADIYTKLKKKYTTFLVAGFSFGAYNAFVSSAKIPFSYQFIFSPALFYENRILEKKFLSAWKKLGTMPDYTLFTNKGIVKPARQKLSYEFVTSLKKYTIQTISRETKTPTVIGCGVKEKLFVKQMNTIYRALTGKKWKYTFTGVGHESKNPLYQKQALNVVEKHLKRFMSHSSA